MQGLTNYNQDISSILISDEGVRQILPTILIDAIILSQDYHITSISQNVLDYMGYHPNDVCGKHINILAGAKDLDKALKTGLRGGYFEGKKISLLCKNGRWISTSISGFYLGLISDINGSIVLKIRNHDELESANRELMIKRVELDNFIYRTAHDLRGPLATMKGLINLMNIRKDDEELKTLIPLLLQYADKLDDRLFQLVYLSQVDQQVNPPVNRVNFTDIESSLRQIISKNALSEFLEFTFAAPWEDLDGLNENLITSLCTNLLLHILSLPIRDLTSNIIFNLECESNHLIITIRSTGFTVSESLEAAIAQIDFIYANLLDYPQLVNFYAAQKIAIGLRSRISFQCIAPENQLTTLSITLSK